jgi:fatty acid desaturase
MWFARFAWFAWFAKRSYPVQVIRVFKNEKFDVKKIILYEKIILFLFLICQICWFFSFFLSKFLIMVVGILWLPLWCFPLLILTLLKVQFGQIWQFFMLKNFEKSSNLVKMVKLPCVFCLKLVKKHQKIQKPGTRVLRFKNHNPISFKNLGFKPGYGFRVKTLNII